MVSIVVLTRPGIAMYLLSGFADVSVPFCLSVFVVPLLCTLRDGLATRGLQLSSSDS